MSSARSESPFQRPPCSLKYPLSDLVPLYALTEGWDSRLEVYTFQWLQRQLLAPHLKCSIFQCTNITSFLYSL